jgi:hypothetical protein
VSTDCELRRSEVGRNAKIQPAATNNTQRIRILPLQQGIILLALTEEQRKLREFRSPPQSSDVLTRMVIFYEKALSFASSQPSRSPGGCPVRVMCVRLWIGRIRQTPRGLEARLWRTSRDLRSAARGRASTPGDWNSAETARCHGSGNL